jgi:outer membrane lipoprotein SlyB
MQSFGPWRIVISVAVLTLNGCSALEAPPQYIGSQATEDERYCNSVAQYEAEQVRRQNIKQQGAGAVAGAAVGGVVGRLQDPGRSIEGATIGAIGGASAAYLATKDQMRSAYDTAYRRCMEQRPAK